VLSVSRNVRVRISGVQVLCPNPLVCFLCYKAHEPHAPILGTHLFCAPSIYRHPRDFQTVGSLGLEGSATCSADCPRGDATSQARRCLTLHRPHKSVEERQKTPGTLKLVPGYAFMDPPRPIPRRWLRSKVTSVIGPPLSHSLMS